MFRRLKLFTKEEGKSKQMSPLAQTLPLTSQQDWRTFPVTAGVGNAVNGFEFTHEVFVTVKQIREVEAIYSPPMTFKTVKEALTKNGKTRDCRVHY